MTVLVTGAAGRIGSSFAAHAASRYRLRLSDRPDVDMSALRAHGEVVPADLGDPEAMRRLCSDVDTVVHLAGEPSPHASWEKLLAANVIGAYHAFAAAVDAGCRRFVAEQRGMSVVVLRIGAYQRPEVAETLVGKRIDHIYVSPRDLNQLMVRAIDFAGPGFLLVNATGANSVQRLDPGEAVDVLGYRPLDGFVDGRLQQRQPHRSGSDDRPMWTRQKST